MVRSRKTLPEIYKPYLCKLMAFIDGTIPTMIWTLIDISLSDPTPIAPWTPTSRSPQRRKTIVLLRLTLSRTTAFPWSDSRWRLRTSATIQPCLWRSATILTILCTISDCSTNSITCKDSHLDWTILRLTLISPDSKTTLIYSIAKKIDDEQRNWQRITSLQLETPQNFFSCRAEINREHSALKSHAPPSIEEKTRHGCNWRKSHSPYNRSASFM